MNFRVFKCYMKVCKDMMLSPSWQGLEAFRLFCLNGLEGLEVRG